MQYLEPYNCVQTKDLWFVYKIFRQTMEITDNITELSIK